MTPPSTLLVSYGLGTGHLVVAENLCSALGALGHRTRHEPLERWVPREYDWLFRRGYLLLALHAPSVWDWMYSSPRFTKREVLALPVMRQRAAKRFGERVLKEGDLVVATQFNAMEVAADRKRFTAAGFRLAVVITDYDVYPLWARPEVDLFLMPHEDLVPRLEARGVPRERILVTGLPISEAFGAPVDVEDVKTSLGLSPDAPVVLVLGGGVGAGPLKEAAEQILRTSDWHVILVCGKNEALRRRLVPFAQANPERLRVLGFRRDIPALMAASEAVVTKGGGLSLTEALYSRRRVVALPSLPGQEVANLGFMEERGWVSVCRNLEGLGTMLGRPGQAPPPARFPQNPLRRAAEALNALAPGAEPGS
jgi:processive 1,2-diacylglycerol beta-glucosyltransferase